MSFLVYYAVFLVVLATLVFLGIFVKKKNEKKFVFVLKTFSLVLSAFFTVRYMWGKDAISDIFKLSSTPFDTKTGSFFGLISVWLSYCSVLLMCLYSFFRGKLTNNLVKFIGFPFAVFCTICLPFNITAICGSESVNIIGARAILMAIEQGICLAISLLVLIFEVNWKDLFNKNNSRNLTKKHLNFNSFCKNLWIFIKRAWFPIFCVLGLLLSTMPAFTFWGLFGKAGQGYGITGLKLYHRIILYIGFILPVIIHKTLKSKDFSTKKFLILYLCIGSLIGYSLTRKIDVFLDPAYLPLHLCNTAMYIMPIVLIFNMKRTFYFTYFINVLGALIAMLVPSYNVTANFFEPTVVSFYINHFTAFFMPILFVSLKLFKRPKLKEYIYSMIGFAVYFILVVFLNSLFTGLHEIGLASRSTDFFFVNSDYVASKLGRWCEDLRNITVSFNMFGATLVFYPVYQVLFLLVYFALGLAVWFIYAYAYNIADYFTVLNEKNKKIRLDEIALCDRYNQKEVKDCMNENSKGKLVVSGASKRYGNNKNYSLENATFEVKEGEILGFLGPNGAGKSTLIKCIVGMQPLTEGRIEINGYDIEKQPVVAKKQFGFVPDHYALYEKLTGREYVNYIADLYDVTKQDRDERINKLLKMLNLEDAFDNKIRTYSHGMKQKVAIISALVHNPKLWILDEPLTGLDPTSIHQVKQCMLDHAKNGNIVFFSSHIIDIVEKLCNRIIIIKDGKIRKEAKLSSLKKKGEELEKFYLDTIKEDGEKPKKKEK